MSRFSAALIVLLASLAADAQPFLGYATFDGTSNAFLKTSGPGPQPTGAATIEFWLRVTRANGPGEDCRSLLGKQWMQTYWLGVCRVNDQMTLRSYTRGSGSPISRGLLPLGSWVHVAVTTDGTRRRHYLGGELVGDEADGGPPTANTEPLQVGNDAAWVHIPDAEVDELRIWTVARTSAEIRGWMRSPMKGALPQPGLLALYPFDGDGSEVVAGNALSQGGPATAPIGSAFGGARSLFVPVVLKNQFSSELTVTNRGATAANVTLRYTATSGGGTGTTTFSLAPYHQRVFPDVLDYLRSQGLAISDSGTRLGTLRVSATGLSDADALATTVRTATDVANPAGRAGLAYAGIPVEKTLNETAWLAGLTFGTTTERTNLALQNAGAAADGSVTLRVSVFDAEGRAGAVQTVTLAEGGFVQFSSGDLGLVEGFRGSAKVERLAGTARFYAYAVLNDQANSDGSFITPVTSADLTSELPTIPSVVEAGAFRTEFWALNTTEADRTVSFRLRCGSCTPSNSYDSVIGPRKLFWVGDAVASLRYLGSPPSPIGAGTLTLGTAGVGPAYTAEGIALFARTSAVVPGSGKFGVAYPGVRPAQGAPIVAWVNALRKDATNRTNLAFANLGGIDDTPSSFRVEIFDGDAGIVAATVDTAVSGLVPGGFAQLSGVLNTLAPAVSNGFARITRLSGNNPFAVYAVVNDGANPGERTGDGAYVAMDVPFRN